MIDFLSRMEQVFAELPDKTAFRMGDSQERLTYRELDEYSGKVYRYLKENGIGKEDIVMIFLPRSIMIFAAMLGVWKVGAALVVAETTTAKERADYIRGDCGCKCFLDEEIFKKILAMKTLPGREKVEKHDLAYLIYTSGSTGNPKGVLHEYGNLDKITPNKRCDGDDLIKRDTVIAYNSSLSFVAAVQELVDIVNHGATMILIPSECVRNLPALMALYERTGVELAFMTPSMFRACKSLNSQLRTVMLSAEPCCGVQDDRVRLVNAYSASEAGRILCTFRIEKAYDKTPVGKNQGGEEILLMDEDGHPVKDGEAGEICYKNEYMRGYHHLPERTAEAFRGGVYHSGDLAFLDADQNITIIGRKDDMIKINGNRVEPGEAATAVKDVLGLSWCAARGFVNEGGKAYLCVYYLRGAEFDENELRKKLKSKLPEYMIPAYFIAIDEVPLLPTGKLNKRALPEPTVRNLKGPYEPPQNALEEKIIAEMEKTLGIRQIGRCDSFRRLGGDSVAAMVIASNLSDEIPDTSLILTCDTPAEIAKAALERADGADSAQQNAELEKSYEITTGSYFFYAHPDDPVVINSEIRLNKAVDAERLQEAADAMLREIPFLSLSPQKAPDGSRYLLVPADKPFAVVRRDDYVPVFSEDARGYLLTISCAFDTIRMVVFHGLTDGKGMNTAMTCLLRNYLRLTGDAVEKTERRAYSYADPDACFEKLPMPKHALPYSCPASLAFSRDEQDPYQQKNSLISFSMSSALHLARSSEGSVQAILMIALGEAILRASEGKKKQVTVSCPMDIRSRLNCPDTLRNCTMSYKFNISEKLLSFPFRDALSAVKGMQYLQDSPGFWIPKGLSSAKYDRAINDIPTIEEKIKLITAYDASSEVGYPVVSFIGNFGLDQMVDRIRSVRCSTNVTGNAGVIMFAYLIRERCYVSLSTNVIDDMWRTHFISILREAGLDVTEE